MAEKNIIWESAGKAGLVLGGVSILYLLLTMLTGKWAEASGPVALVAILNFALWAVKFWACLYLMRLFMQRIYNDYFKRRRPTVNVVIYGAGAAGVIANNALKQDLHYEYNVVAFIDDDPAKVNQQLDGVPVRKNRQVLTPKFVEQKKVTQLIIAIPTVRLIHKQAITNRALDLGLTVKSVPHISKWMNDTFSSSDAVAASQPLK